MQVFAAALWIGILVAVFGIALWIGSKERSAYKPPLTWRNDWLLRRKPSYHEKLSRKLRAKRKNNHSLQRKPSSRRPR